MEHFTRCIGRKCTNLKASAASEEAKASVSDLESELESLKTKMSDLKKVCISIRH
jgi:hypothetical protein